MVYPTWEELTDGFCSNKKNNPNYEYFASRRYNYAASNDRHECRLIFLKHVLKDKNNKTLCRDGRFIWCKNLTYEGRNSEGVRSISFTIGKGQKRFYIGENNILCLPSHICVANNRFFRQDEKTFFPFSSVFSYEKTIQMMMKNSDDKDKLIFNIHEDNPYRPGTLVMPRRGYFYPETRHLKLDKDRTSDRQHPCGIIIGPSLTGNQYVSKEFYRVRFGDMTYEKIHPVQMEIVNEV